MTRGEFDNLRQARRFYMIGPDVRVFVFRSNHPLEERLLELTDDYRDADGVFIVPELLAWDGVETCPGIIIAPR